MSKRVNPYLARQNRARTREAILLAEEAKKPKPNVTTAELVAATRLNRQHSEQFKGLDRSERSILEAFSNVTKKIEDHAVTYSKMRRLKSQLDSQIALNEQMAQKMRENDAKMRKLRVIVAERENELGQIRSFVKQASTVNARVNTTRRK